MAVDEAVIFAAGSADLIAHAGSHLYRVHVAATNGGATEGLHADGVAVVGRSGIERGGDAQHRVDAHAAVLKVGQGDHGAGGGAVARGVVLPTHHNVVAIHLDAGAQHRGAEQRRVERGMGIVAGVAAHDGGHADGVVRTFGQAAEGDGGVADDGVAQAREADHVGRGAVGRRPAEADALRRDGDHGQLLRRIVGVDLYVVDGHAPEGIVVVSPLQGHADAGVGYGAEADGVATVAAHLRGQGVDRVESVERFVVVAYREGAVRGVLVAVVEDQRQAAQPAREAGQQRGGRVAGGGA